MKRTLTIVAIYICAFSCGHQPKTTPASSREQLHSEFIDIMLDTTASWKQVTDIVYPFVDSLCAAAADETSLSNRIYGQQWGYMTINLLSEVYSDMKEAGKDVNYDDVTTVLEQLADAMTLWFYSPDGQIPNIWRDHYYVCHQHSEEPIDGFFHLMVTLPTEAQPEPTLRIFYPDSAEGSPLIIFSKYVDNDSVDEDEDSRDLVYLNSWTPKDDSEDGFPMYAFGDASVVERMLNNDVAYLMFESGTSPNGASGETEIARLSLNSFQKKWKEIVH